MHLADRTFRPAADEAEVRIPWSRITAWFLVSRFFIFLIGYLSTYIVEEGPTPQRRAPLDVFRHWDADWYLRIAQTGYPVTPDQIPRTAFFPLYPLLVRGVGWFVHDFRLAGYLVSNALLLASCGLLWRLVVRDQAFSTIADLAVLFFLFSPVSFFFSSIYTESLFFLLLLGTMYHASAGRWLKAGCFAYLAALTRHVGVLVIIPLAVEFGLQIRRLNAGSPGAQRLPADTPAFLVCLCAAAAGLGTYALFLARTFGNPFEFLVAEQHWHRYLSFPGRALHLQFAAFYDVWFHAAVLVGLILFLLGIRFRLPALQSVLTASYFVIYLSASHLEAIPRFLSVLFPFYITLGLICTRWPQVEPLLLGGSAMLLAFSVVLFVNGYWFT